MFFSIRLRKRVGIICCAAIALLIIIVALQRAIVTDAPANSVPVPIIMYHSIVDDPAKAGQYVITPATLEEDIKFLKEQGYTTVNMKDLIEYVEKGVPLPPKPIMLTFDDGYYNNCLYAYPLMKKYGCKMVLSVVGQYTDEYSQSKNRNPGYAYCNWDDLKEMSDSGLVEIQNHSYNMHTISKQRKGCKKVSGESLDQYHQTLSADLTKLQTLIKEKVGVAPTTFTYPYGAISKESVPLIKSLGFSATLSCESHVNYITQDKECLYRLGRYLRPSGLKSRDYFRKMLKLSDTSAS